MTSSDVNLISAGNWKETQTIGISVSSDENSFSFFAGETEIKDRITQSSTQMNGSLIASGNDVIVNADNAINQIGSDISATNNVDVPSNCPKVFRRTISTYFLLLLVQKTGCSLHYLIILSETFTKKQLFAL